MLWNFQMMSNDVRELHKRGIHKLDEFMIDGDGVYRRYKSNNNFYNRVNSNDYKKEVGVLEYIRDDFANTTGTSLGYVIDYSNLSKMMEEEIRNSEGNAYGFYNFYQYPFLSTSIYNSGICSCSWYISSNKLNFNIILRNINLLTDLPSLIVQCACLQNIMAKVGKLDVGIINFSIENAYVKSVELEKLNEYLDRWNLYQRMTRINREELIRMKKLLTDIKLKYKLNSYALNDLYARIQIIDMILNPSKPELWINPNINSIFDIDNSSNLRHIKIKGYRPFVNLK